MFVVRETFTARPGSASKLASMFKDVFASMPDMRMRVMTDFIGQFNTVVLETEVEDLNEFDRRMAEYMADNDLRAKMKGYTDMYLTGRREVFKIV